MSDSEDLGEPSSQALAQRELQSPPHAGAVFVFSGHGSQWERMAVDLFDASPVFADRLRACEQALRPHVGWSLLDVLRRRPRARRLARVDVVQPALFAVSVSLAELWRECGVQPAALVGHSQGEVAAAYLAGGLTLEDAAAIVARRARLLVSLSAKGGMLAVSLTRNRLEQELSRLGGGLELGAINGPSALAVTGEREALARLLASCRTQGIRAAKVAIDYASHSRQVEALRPGLLDALAGVAPRHSEIPIYSTVTGELLDTSECDAVHWYRAERETVQLEAATTALLECGLRTFVEVGPHPVLVAALQETVDGALGDGHDALIVGSLRRNQAGPQRLLAALGDLSAQGLPIDLEAASRLLGLDPARGVAVVVPAAASAAVSEPDPNRACADDGPPDEGRASARDPASAGATVKRSPIATREGVLGEVAAVLGIATLEGDADRRAFRDLGIDSAGVVELRNRLRKLTGRRISSALLFDHPTPAALAERLARDAADRPTPAGCVSGFVVDQRRSTLEGPEEPIAIVGMSCRFPGGVYTPEDLWRLVAGGGDGIAPFPADRGWDLDRLYDPDPDRPGTVYAREGGFVYDVGHFDAAFFGISPREALMMDPQQRLFLETSWEAIERSGIDPKSLSASQTGVFAGSNIRDYNASQLIAPNGLEGYSLTGTAGSILSGRVAYLLGLEGPALTIDTACSSSLVALHLACAALLRGDCSLALAGGVTVINSPALFAAFSRQRALAPDGRCKPFADAADGTGWGEGAGVLVLERLSQARAAGRRVLALVRGSAVNQDGASNGMTAPSGLAQQRVIAQALSRAGLSVTDVDIVEAHGTGTKLGDPIEADALIATYGQRPADRPLWLGSIKSNIGHTQAAAGVAGVIKMVMAIQHGSMPPTLHVDRPSEEVEWSSGAVSLLTDPVRWETDGRPRRAGVSSYGISGTNAHVILEQCCEQDAGGVGVLAGKPVAGEPVAGKPVAGGLAGGVGNTRAGRDAGPGEQGQRDFYPICWPISARGTDALRAQAERLASFLLDDRERVHPRDLALALARRSSFEHRAAIVGRDLDDLSSGLARLTSADSKQETSSRRVLLGCVERDRPIAFLFTGQGAQRVGMGSVLHRELPAFRSAFDSACAQLDAELGRPLRPIVFGEPEEAAGDGLLDRTLFTQPALFALEVALFEQLRAWGVRPDFLIGHSIGELAAAYVAGVFSLQDACRLVAARARLMDELPDGGAMLAVQASEPEALAWLEGCGQDVALAAVNGPDAIVLSGSRPAIERAAEQWRGRERKTKRLTVSHAFHSRLMEPMLAAFAAVAESVSFREPSVPIVSNLTGEPVGSELCEPDYWVRHVRETVRFAAGAEWLLRQGVGTFLELGPDGVLSAMLADVAAGSPARADSPTPSAFSLLKRERDEPSTLLEGLAQAWVEGVAVDWRRVHARPGARWIELPTYAFQREHYWLELPRGFWMDEQGRITAAGAGGGGVDAAAEREFWQAVEEGDPTRLAELLDFDPGESSPELADLLAALSAWRERQAEQALGRDWRYQVKWRPAVGGDRSLVGRWVLAVPTSLAEDRRVAALERTLERRGARVVRVNVGPGLPERAELASLLVANIAMVDVAAGSGRLGPDDGNLPQLGGVLSLLALQEGAPASDCALPAGLAGTLLLAQALADLELSAPVWIATQGAVSIGESDRVLAADQRMAWGLGQVLRIEDPQRWGGLVDLPTELGQVAFDRLCDALARAPEEDELAIRTTGIFVRRLAREVSDRRTSKQGWHVGGTALLTGGTGAVAGHLARWLARAGVERIVLASRSGESAPGARELVGELVEIGAEAMVVACDVCEREQVESLLNGLAEGPPLSMVFHAAGVLEDELIDKLTPERMETVLAPKVRGALHLHELTAGLDLRAFVLFSSVSATLGAGGQAAYAAGNAFLDALADRRREAGLPVTSVAWGAWGGGGMAATVAEHLLRRGVREMPPDSALAVLHDLLQRGSSHAVVADLDWERYARSATRVIPVLSELDELAFVRERKDREAGSSQQAPAFAVQLADLPRAACERLALELVQEEAAIVLGHPSREAIHPQRAFGEIGFDSLSGVELRNRLIGATGLSLPTTVIFDYPTASELAEHLLEQALGASTRGTAAPSARHDGEEPMAIVGMACRFPGGAESPEQLWDLLARGGDAITPFPTDRGWEIRSIYHPDPEHPGTTYAREGGFLEHVSEFDAAFFGIGPREALAMSPQQRIVLETAWEALERAGIDPRSLGGTDTGVYVGESLSDYSTGLFGSTPDEVKSYLGTGNAGSIVSGRVAYALGLEGPAVTINTACSSSLVAMHLAARAIRAGECSLALVGGVTVMATPSVFVDFSRQRGTAPDGRCKAFADAADGAGWGEGVGILVLEPLSRALANERDVLAVVRGSAINQDGASNGLTAPSGRAQQKVILRALEQAGLSASDVDAVEAHGTGTRLGDPIEAQAIMSTYGRERDAERPLWLGSIKSNIGHTQAAAGVAGVIKMVMALRRERLPRTLHAGKPSTRIDWTAGAVSLLVDEVPWPRNGRPRRAGVSSFGISGTNAHVILEEPPAVESRVLAASTARSGPLAWVLSARSETALRAQAASLHEHLRIATDVPAADVAVSLAARPQLEHRAVLVGGARESLLAAAGSLADGAPTPETSVGLARAVRPTAFLFTGQGAQRAGMGAELYRIYPAFADALEDVCGPLAELLGIPLRDLMFAAEGSREAPMLDDTTFTQAALFAFEVALFRLLESVGMRPDYLIGHSVGEIAAAHVAGVLSLADACTLVAARGRLMGALPPGGAMLAVQGSERELRESIAEGAPVSIAAVNGPSSVVLSGEESTVRELGELWRERGRKTRRLRVSHAFHSALMEPMLEQFAQVAAGLAYAPPAIPVVSNLNGRVAGEELCGAEYWVRHVRETVRFADGVLCLLERGVGNFLEVGPDGALSAMVSECVGGFGPTADERRRTDTAESDEEDAPAPIVAAALRAGRDELSALLSALACVWTGGVSVDWRAVLAGSDGRRVQLPTYAFQRERFWLDSVERGGIDPEAVGQSASDHPLLGAAVALADERGWLFTGRLSLEEHPWLADHAVLGEVLLPGTALLELALYAGAQLDCQVVEELTLHTPLVLSSQQAVQLQLCVEGAEQDGRRSLSIYSRGEQDEAAANSERQWVCHASGLLVAAGSVEAVDSDGLDGVWPPAGAEPLQLEDAYDALLEQGLEYGPAFQGLVGAWRLGSELFAEVRLAPRERERGAAFALHPAALDAALHAAALVAAAEPTGEDGRLAAAHLPFCWSSVQLDSRGADAVRVRLSKVGEDSLRIAIADADGRALGSVGSLSTRAASATAIAAAAPGREGRYRVEWQPLAAMPAARAETPELARLDFTTLDGELPADAHLAIARLLEELQAWLGDERLRDSRLAIVTRGAVAVEPGERAPQLVASALWGLVRSAQAENPGRFLLVDLDGDGDVSDETLARALAAGEPQLAIRDGEPLVARLVRSASARALEPPAGESAWRLDGRGADTLDALRLVPCPERLAPLDPGEVRVQVHAAGVNFKDVLIALGVYPGAAEIGNEAAGIVLEVGSAVEHLAVGDRVCGLFAGAFGPLAVGDARLVARVPRAWSLAQAAAVPLAFLTAYYALVDLADLKPGQRLLVHAATGGVGTAAIQLASHLGAQVLATASERKHAVLEAAGLPATHIASSRDASFAERFLAGTDGAGVDAVLNSLTGELVDASLRLLPRGGSFLEMGKTDVRDEAAVARAHPAVRYRAFDLMDAGPARIQEMLGALMELFERGELEPPPVRAWDVRHGREALRFMSQARHVGKLVLTMPGRGLERSDTRSGTTLITGGTGGLGRLLARHLVETHGARHLLLASRTGERSQDIGELERELAQAGAEVRVVSCDVSDREQVRRLIDSVDPARPLRAVIHAAGVLDDGLVGSLTAERTTRVLAPKLDGAWHLHELTAGLDLDAFVLFSSVAGTLGAPGQANYAAANAFLEALAAHRRADGLPAVAMSWGPWEQASGMTAGLAQADFARMAGAGLRPLTSEYALELFDEALGGEDSLAVLARVDPVALGARAAREQLPAVLRALVRRTSRPGRVVAQSASALAANVHAAPVADRRRIVREFVRAQTAAVLGHSSEQAIDSTMTFKDLGFDSLAAVELRNRLGAATGLKLSATLVFDHPTLGALVGHLLDELAAAATTTTGSSGARVGAEREPDLDELARSLSRISAEQAQRSGIAARLRELLAGWASESDLLGPEQAIEDGDLADAADDELFELIDREFGVS